MRLGGILLIVGLLHGLNVLMLPIIGRILTLNRRLDEQTPRAAPAGPSRLNRPCSSCSWSRSRSCWWCVSILGFVGIGPLTDERRADRGGVVGAVGPSVGLLIGGGLLVASVGRHRSSSSVSAARSER